jgi:hypothetical protein
MEMRNGVLSEKMKKLEIKEKVSKPSKSVTSKKKK